MEAFLLSQIPILDHEVIEKGEVVFRIDTVRAEVMERWVEKVRQLSGQRVDWYYGGPAIVKALGDIARVKRVIVSIEKEILIHRCQELKKINVHFACDLCDPCERCHPCRAA